MSYNEETTMDEMRAWANGIMFDLMDQLPDGFSGDDFNREVRKLKMPPAVIKELAGATFRQFESVGYIEKTGGYILSERNSAPLPTWRKRA